MGEGIKKKLSILLIAAILLGVVEIPALAQEGERGVTVSSREEFMDALNQKISPITVNANISIGDQAEASGRMKPVVIPGGTVIQGVEGTESGLICRSPIQLAGDGVVFQNMDLQMTSSNAMQSLPHREIFLAGYSLTMDNVSTWLAGGNGENGDLGGTEKELLPTVYAGGYPGTEVGSCASLTVRNSNEDTVFQAIYLGHGAGNDGNVPYQGLAKLNMDAMAAVRDSVDVSPNSRAEIRIAGGKNDSAKTNNFWGNENTTLTLSKSMMEKASVEGIGNLIIEDEGCLLAVAGSFGNVTLKSGGCLDLNGFREAEIKGDFTGVSAPGETQGILVVNQEGSVTIGGKVTGTTLFQTSSRHFPSWFVPGKVYIRTDASKAEESNFVLSEKSIGEGYRLRYENGAWITDRDSGIPKVGKVEIVSAPQEVDLSKIRQASEEWEVPDETIFFEIVWYDEKGAKISNEDAEQFGLYDMDYVVGIKTEYWESDGQDVLEKTDWWNSITLLPDPGEHPGRYYLQADSTARSGDDTFLFLSEYYSGELDTVGDVKALQDHVVGQQRVLFWDSEKGEEKPVVTPIPKPTGTPTPTLTPPKQEGHTHQYRAVLERATFQKDGVKMKKCSCGKIIEQQTIYWIQKVELSNGRLVYNGRSREPKVKVIDRTGQIVGREQYQVIYQNSVDVGQGTAIIYFSGDYSGSQKKNFIIEPKATSLSSVKARKKGFTVKWKKQNKQTTGYEIQYSTSSKFAKKSTKTTIIKNNKATMKTISKQKAKKKYYIRIRTYKTVKVNGKSMKLSSKWSKIRSVKTKK